MLLQIMYLLQGTFQLLQVNHLVWPQRYKMYIWAWKHQKDFTWALYDNSRHRLKFRVSNFMRHCAEILLNNDSFGSGNKEDRV